MRDMDFSAPLAKEIRERRGLNRVAAARAAGLSRQGLINIEDGVSVPGVDTLGRLATAYGASVDEFYVHGSDADTPASAGEESTPNSHGDPAAAATRSRVPAHQGG